MIRSSRYLLVVLAAFAVVFVAAALGQAAFSLVVPELSARIIGSTDIATYVLLCLEGVFSFAFGFLVPRWLKGPLPIFWLLLPIVAIYLLAIFLQPYAFRCSPLKTYVVSCWVVLSPFVVSAAAIVLGFLCRAWKARLSLQAV